MGVGCSALPSQICCRCLRLPEHHAPYCRIRSNGIAFTYFALISAASDGVNILFFNKSFGRSPRTNSSWWMPSVPTTTSTLCTSTIHCVGMEAFRECLRKLPERDRKFLIDIYRGDRSLRDIAKDKGVSHQALMKRRDRLFKRIREMMIGIDS